MLGSTGRVSRAARAFLLAAALAALPVARAEAQPSVRARALAITVSGGVSLGAYEAGYLYYLTETLKRNPTAYTLRAVTGASAGSANGLLALLSMCSPPDLDPSQSLFFRTWTDVGLDELYVPGEAQSTGMFSRRALQTMADRIAARWRQGLPEDCDVVLGVATTRLRARDLRIRTHAFTLPRIEEKFVLRVRGAGRGRPPDLSNYVDPTWKVEQPLLPLDGSRGADFQPVADLLFASMAFPLAFAPMPLRHCMTDPSSPDGSAACAPQTARTDLFIDGGVLDNQPLRLATRILAGGLDADGRFRDVPDRRQEALPPDARFIYLQPDTRSYPKASPPTAPRWSALDLAGNVLATFLESARSKELLTLFDERPEVRDELSIATTPYPPISELLFAFFGFFDKKFRAFDFDLGMYAAYRYIQDRVRTNLAPGDAGAPFATLAEALPHGADGRVTPAFRPFECIRGVLDADAAAARACADPALEDTRVLLQVTADRLATHCRALARETPAPRTKHAACAAAMAGGAPPLVPGVSPTAAAAWERRDDENDFGYVTRLLALHRFVFADLKLGPDDADQAPLRMRYALARSIAGLADAQPSDGALLDTVAVPALNTIAYAPPRHIVYATIGSALEAGWSFTNPTAGWRWLRPEIAVTGEAFSALATGTLRTVWVMPSAGFEVAPDAWSGPTTQVHLGARAGWLLSSADGFATGGCDPSPGPCSRFAATGFLSASVVERFRLQVEGLVLPPRHAGDAAYWAVLPGAGLQFRWF
jgi:predicted acylesterase/phospholipase RssA